MRVVLLVSTIHEIDLLQTCFITGQPQRPDRTFDLCVVNFFHFSRLLAINTWLRRPATAARFQHGFQVHADRVTRRLEASPGHLREMRRVRLRHAWRRTELSSYRFPALRKTGT